MLIWVNIVLFGLVCAKLHNCTVEIVTTGSISILDPYDVANETESRSFRADLACRREQLFMRTRLPQYDFCERDDLAISLRCDESLRTRLLDDPYERGGDVALKDARADASADALASERRNLTDFD